jgi:hypothetical protein
VVLAKEAAIPDEERGLFLIGRYEVKMPFGNGKFYNQAT